MNREVSPVVVVVVIALVVIVAGFWLWRNAEGRTFTKSSVRGIQFDISKAKQAAPSGQ